MKSLIFFCLLVALCSAQRFPSYPSNIVQQASEGIKKAKSSVQSIMSGIDRTSNNYEMDVSRQINNFYSQAYGNVRDIRDRQLKYIQDKLEEAKAAGKDAEDCLNAVAVRMKFAASTAYAEVDRYLNQAKQQMRNEIQEFKKTKAIGQQLINQLDRIALECYSSNIQQMGNCMITKLALVNMDIRQYQQTISQKEKQLSDSKREIPLAQYSSNQSAISKLQSASSSVIHDAVDCLKS